MASMKNIIERFEEKFTEADGGCWLWSGTKTLAGYGTIYFSGKQLYAHRVSWVIHCGAIPMDAHVLHSCDVRNCVNPDHLFVGSNQDNVVDCVTKMRHAWGEKNGHSTLTIDEIQLAKDRYLGGDTQRQIAEDLGVTQPAISRIVRGERWPYA